MPTVLRIGFGLLGLVLVSAGCLLAWNPEAWGAWLFLALGLFNVIALWFGVESVRAAVRYSSGVIAAIGLLVTYEIVKHQARHGIPAGEEAGFLIAALAGVVAGVTGTFLFWCLGRADVQDWLLRRSLGER